MNSVANIAVEFIASLLLHSGVKMTPFSSLGIFQWLPFPGLPLLHITAECCSHRKNISMADSERNPPWQTQNEKVPTGI